MPFTAFIALLFPNLIINRVTGTIFSDKRGTTILVIREILKMQSERASNVEKLRQAAKACVVLSPLLGMTWVFGT